MPLDKYGVLRARVLEVRRDPEDDSSPHLQLLMDVAGTAYRGCVNVRSRLAPSELLYLALEEFDHPVLEHLEGLEDGWTELPRRADGAALDYVRANLFRPEQMRPLPTSLPDSDNDLYGALEHHLRRAVGDDADRVLLFGEPWGPEPDTPDKIFGFRPGRGVHNVHMNQGNHWTFERDDGVWQDGALLVHHARFDQWVAVFLAFQSQSWHTSDTTGHALTSVSFPGNQEASYTDGRLRVVGALVNPIGPNEGLETVTVLNVSADPIDLTGWQFLDRQHQANSLPAEILAPGDTRQITLTPPMQLGNRGGQISLIDPDGRKVDGVAYTGRQARREGWTVVF